jgi:hypothetical protein
MTERAVGPNPADTLDFNIYAVTESSSGVII